MATYSSNEIREKVWNQLIKQEGLPERSRAALDLKENTEEAIDVAIVMTAQAIFTEIASKQRIVPEVQGTGIVESRDIIKIKDKWLHDTCNFCEKRKPSVILRGDGKWICATCETEVHY